MAYFTDEQDLYTHIGGLFEGLIADDELAQKMIGADTIIQYVYREPAAQITVKLLEDEPPQVDLGPTQLEPEVTLTMDADLAHRFWLGKVNVMMALARGQVKAQGPVTKMMSLMPLVASIVPRYRAQLEAAGRADLAEVD